MLLPALHKIFLKGLWGGGGGGAICGERGRVSGGAGSRGGRGAGEAVIVGGGWGREVFDLLGIPSAKTRGCGHSKHGDHPGS